MLLTAGWFLNLITFVPDALNRRAILWEAGGLLLLAAALALVVLSDRRAGRLRRWAAFVVFPAAVAGLADVGLRRLAGLS